MGAEGFPPGSVVVTVALIPAGTDANGVQRYNVHVNGPVDQWWVCNDVLDAGKEQIKRHHAQKHQSSILAAPSSVLQQLPPLNGR